MRIWVGSGSLPPRSAYMSSNIGTMNSSIADDGERTTITSTTTG